MNPSAAWSCLFFVGLLLACAHLPDFGRTAPQTAACAPTMHRGVAVRRTKIAIGANDVWLHPREPALAVCNELTVGAP
jgi:hypothetical protein